MALNPYFDDAHVVDFTKNLTDKRLLDLEDAIDDVCGCCPISQPNGDAYCRECPVSVLWKQIQDTIYEEG